MGNTSSDDDLKNFFETNTFYFKGNKESTSIRNFFSPKERKKFGIETFNDFTNDVPSEHK